MARRAAFAIPGDIDTLTGGYIYEKRVLEGLRAGGRRVEHIPLGGGFPAPSDSEMRQAADALRAVEVPLILDGFVVGAMDPRRLAEMTVPMVGIVHHPLALEVGLDAARKQYLYATECENLSRMAHVLVPSQHTAGVLVERYGVPREKITIAPPGVEKQDAERTPVRPPLILSVGIIHARKGHDVLIVALDRLKDLEWQAIIVGGSHDDAYAESLSRRIAECGLGHRVALAGRVSADRLGDLYRSARVFALATRYEGYGMVFAEALAHGLPIVTCNTGAVPDTVPQGCGILVPPEDPRSFAGALRRMLTDPALCASIEKQVALARLSLPRWADTAAAFGRVLDRVASQAS